MFLKSKFVFFALVVLLVVTACASGPKVHSDYDPSVDFSQFRTFGFFDPLSIEGENYSSIFGQAFRDSIGRELRALGYTESENPDLKVNVSARLNEKTDVSVSANPYMSGYYYGYRRGYYDPWMGYGFGTTTHVNQYTEGTVNIDIIDMAKKRMVWEGIAIGRVKENRNNAEIRQAISDAVSEMFAGYQVQVKQ